jgi:hypothetical protein
MTIDVPAKTVSHDEPDNPIRRTRHRATALLKFFHR